MLIRARILLILVGAILLPLSAPTLASADDVECREIVRDDGTVIQDCSASGGGGGGGNPRPPAEEGGGGGSSEGCFTSTGHEVDCETEWGVWTGSCYERPKDPQPPYEDPIWGGRTEGVIVECTIALDPTDWTGATVVTTARWAATASGAVGPSPLELAERAVAAMNLDMGTIGTTPPAGTNPSLVGLPIWLWVTNPAENTTGPITRSETDGGLTVSATGTLDRIEYEMRDNATGAVVASVTCAGDAAAGTPYDPSYEDAPSPTCGIQPEENQSVGTYTITGDAYWSVEWSGGGQQGTINVPVQSSSIQLEVDQLQVIQVD